MQKEPMSQFGYDKLAAELKRFKRQSTPCRCNRNRYSKKSWGFERKC